MIIKAILMIALALALAITLTIHVTSPQAKPLEGSASMEPVVNSVKMRTSRFLAEDPKARNPRAADHCHMDGEVCAATNTHCCNNKCVDLHNDSQNCGACKNKCKFTESCCGGQCVKLSFDKRHCGSCGNKCFKGQYCIYGMCDYA